MITDSNEKADWRIVATVEVTGLSSLDMFFGGILDQFRFQPADRSPSGFSWFDAYVDFGIGEHRAAHVANALLSMLQQLANEGHLEGYRVVVGQHWLAIGDQVRVGAKLASAGH